MAKNCSPIALPMAGLLAIACEASQTFPTKPVRIVVPFAAGSGADTNPRFYGELLRKQWGQAVVVDNRPGGSGIVAVQAVKNAAPDGYTLLTATTSVLSVNPVVIKDLPYDPIKDFRPVILFALGPTAFVVGGGSGVRTIGSLIATAKASGSMLTIGTYSAGYELISTWFSMINKITLTAVPYKGAPHVMTDVMSGELIAGVVSFESTVPLVKEGRLRALAMTAKERHPILPDVPTMRELGFSEFVNYSYVSIFARSETPEPLLKKLHEDFRTVMASPEGRAFQAARPSIIVDYTPQQIRDFVASDAARFRGIARAAGVEPR